MVRAARVTPWRGSRGVSSAAVSMAMSVVMAVSGAGLPAASPAGRTCEPIRVELCRSGGYNMTTMPNLAGHEFQKEADGHLSTFAPLVQYGCSSQLLLFLCAVLVPMCTDKVPEPIGPCRGLCEGVRARCFPVLQGFGYPWPPQMDCAKFPPHNSPNHMCMEGPGEDFPLRDVAPAGVAGVAVPNVVGVLAPAPPPRCHGAHGVHAFSRADKQMAEVWLSIWSGLCFVSSVLALLTLRFGAASLPGARPGARPGVARSARTASWRLRSFGPSPLASLALSYGLLSVGWGTRVLSGRTISVGAPGPGHGPGCEASDLRNPTCAAVFLLTYYFGTSSVLWWVVLTVVWFLSAGLRMSAASLQRHSYLFHLAGWGVPAALTVGVLVLRDVTADQLTGTCQVGATWSTVFVLAPQTAFLCMGLVFLTLGALTQWKSRPPQVPQVQLAQLWPLAAERLGLLAAMGALPMAALVATHALELLVPHSASLLLFQARLLASLVVGVAAPLWVWPGERRPSCPSCPRRVWRHGKQGSTATTATTTSTSTATTAPLLGSTVGTACAPALMPSAAPGSTANAAFDATLALQAAVAAPARTRGHHGARKHRSGSKQRKQQGLQGHPGSETTV